MFKTTLLSAGLAQASMLQRPVRSPYTNAALAALKGGHSIYDAQCYPSTVNMFDSLSEALAQKGSGLFEDYTFFG